MSNNNKILVSIFAILLFVVAGELVYLFFFSSNKLGQKNNSIIPFVSISPAPTPTVLDPGDRAISDNSIKFLTNLKIGIVKSSILHSQLTGTIIKVNYSFAGGLRLQLQGGSTVAYAPEEVKDKMVFVKLNPLNRSEKKVSASDLKLGDRVIIDESVDLLKDLDNMLILSKIIIQ